MSEILSKVINGDLEGVGLTLLGGIAGFLAYAVQTQDHGDTFLWRKALTQFGSSAFVGYLVYSLCLALGVDGLWLGPTVGVFGWLGAVATIQIAKRFIFDRIGLTIEDDKS